MAPDPDGGKGPKRKRELDNAGRVKLSDKKAHAVPPSAYTHDASSAPARPTAIESEPLDTDALLKINEEVRAHFKKGHKSDNKLYGREKKSTPAMTGNASVEKRQARFEAHALAKLLIKSQRKQLPLDGSHIGKMGEWLMLQQPVAGNCLEMAAAAVHLVCKKGAGVARLCQVGAPGDHAFCIVHLGCKPPAPKKIGDFAVDLSGAWVIDPWANIVCEMADYQARFDSKMVKWTLRGKWVGTENMGWVEPADSAYLLAMMSGELSYFDAQ